MNNRLSDEDLRGLQRDLIIRIIMLRVNNELDYYTAWYIVRALNDEELNVIFKKLNKELDEEGKTVEEVSFIKIVKNLSEMKEILSVKETCYYDWHHTDPIKNVTEKSKTIKTLLCEQKVNFGKEIHTHTFNIPPVFNRKGEEEKLEYITCDLNATRVSAFLIAAKEYEKEMEYTIYIYIPDIYSD